MKVKLSWHREGMTPRLQCTKSLRDSPLRGKVGRLIGEGGNQSDELR
jgi:hypothetical protein